jgi:hypothetical protein
VAPKLIALRDSLRWLRCHRSLRWHPHTPSHGPAAVGGTTTHRHHRSLRWHLSNRLKPITFNALRAEGTVAPKASVRRRPSAPKRIVVCCWLVACPARAVCCIACTCCLLQGDFVGQVTRMTCVHVPHSMRGRDLPRGRLGSGPSSPRHPQPPGHPVPTPPLPPPARDMGQGKLCFRLASLLSICCFAFDLLLCFRSAALLSVRFFAFDLLLCFQYASLLSTCCFAFDTRACNSRCHHEPRPYTGVSPRPTTTRAAPVSQSTDGGATGEEGEQA